MEVIKFAFQFIFFIFLTLLTTKIFMELAKYIGEKLALAEIIKCLWRKMVSKRKQ